MSDAIASLGMYPFDHLRAHWDLLWHHIRRGLDHAPAELAWDLDLTDAWQSPDLLLGATCGWPLLTELPPTVQVVGTFDPDVPFAQHGTYRSVIVASKPLSVAEWRARPDTVVAINGEDSLSGAISMWHAWGGRPEHTVVTGAHLESMRAVADGSAHLASIDAVTYALVADAEPAMASRVHVVGHGPSVPSLPLVTAARHAAQVPALRGAIGSAVREPGVAPSLHALRVRGFVPLDRSAYESLPALLPPAS